MTKLLLKVGKILKVIFTSPVWIGCLISILLSKNRNIIKSDNKRYMGGGKSLVFTYLFGEKSFRNVLYHRLNPVISYFLSIFFKPNPTLHVDTQDIGEGLLVVHGDCTYIHAKSIGNNFYVNQCVTIGVIGTRSPIIGDNVRVATGSIVIGGIRIGNNVTIGAGSVIVKDVPDNCVVVGNPARIIKKEGQKVNLLL